LNPTSVLELQYVCAERTAQVFDMRLKTDRWFAVPIETKPIADLAKKKSRSKTQ